MKASFTSDIFEHDYELPEGFKSNEEWRRHREKFILQLLSYGYDVTLLEPMSKIFQKQQAKKVGNDTASLG